MSGGARILVRLATITAGYVAAIVAASVAGWLGMSLVGAVNAQMPGNAPLWASILATIVASLAVGWVFLAWVIVFVAKLSFLPWLVAATISELAAIRSIYFHAGAGLAAGALAAFWRDGRTGPPDEDIAFSIVMVAAGLVGGLVYWAISGRIAGRWLSPVGR